MFSAYPKLFIIIFGQTAAKVIYPAIVWFWVLIRDRPFNLEGKKNVSIYICKTQIDVTDICTSDLCPFFKFSNRPPILKSMSFLNFSNRRPILKSMAISHFSNRRPMTSLTYALTLTNKSTIDLRILNQWWTHYFTSINGELIILPLSMVNSLFYLCQWGRIQFVNDRLVQTHSIISLQTIIWPWGKRS
jgi:hypothetical protein